MTNKDKKIKTVAVLTNNEDDIYCFRFEVIKALADSGFKVIVSCPDGPKLGCLDEIRCIVDKPEIDRRGTNVVADFKLFCHYKKLFKIHRPDVVLTYTAKPNVYAGIAAKQLKIPYICNVTGLGSVLKITGLKNKLIMKLFGASFKHAYCIMFQNSTNMKNVIDAGMVKGKYELLPGSGVNTQRHTVQAYPDGGNGIDGETVVFNYMGRVMHDKGVDDYIEAAKRIKKKYPNTEFNMLGFIEPTELHYEKELDELEKQQIVFYRGNQVDIRPFVARAHATIHPSTYGEGMSNVLLETASSGRPIITTDNPGCRETVKDGETGFIYHGGNVDELCELIEKFLSLDNEARCKMGLAGRKYIEDNFSRDIVVKKYLDVIETLN